MMFQIYRIIGIVMGKWKKASNELQTFLEDMVLAYPCDRKRMFGSEVYFVNNNMFAGVHQDNIFMRMSKEEKLYAMEKISGVGHFEPMEGRIMREYISIPKDVAADGKLVKQLLDLSYGHVSSLPQRKRRSSRSFPAPGVHNPYDLRGRLGIEPLPI